jgi:hypothetical protein
MAKQSQAPRLPDFIGIGAMRAGTSWLRKQLDRHPELWTATPKELHYFDRHFTNTAEDYAAHFADAPPEAIAGEITPAYAILDPEKIATARRWMPELKLLFMMRDPVARAWSHARKDFPQFRGIAAEEASVDELIAFADQPQVAARGEYLTCLRAWLEHFSREQLWCGFLENAASDPTATLTDLFTFLGVDPKEGIDPKAAARRENTRPDAPIPDRFREHLESTLYGQNSELADLLETDLPW